MVVFNRKNSLISNIVGDINIFKGILLKRCSEIFEVVLRIYGGIVFNIVFVVVGLVEILVVKFF